MPYCHDGTFGARDARNSIARLAAPSSRASRFQDGAMAKVSHHVDLEDGMKPPEAIKMK